MQFTPITKLIKISLLATIFFALTGWQTYAQAECAYMSEVVNVKSWDVLNIRKYPSPRSQKIGKIPSAQACIYTYCQVAYYKRSQWVKVKYHGVKGWVHSDYLSEMYDDRKCW
jgi:uncharacterized protein YraI